MEPHHYLVALNLVLLFVLKLTCFLLGYLIVRTGADLLREGISGTFKFKSSLVGVKADLVSASPGLLFLLLGVLLIGYAMWLPKEIPFEEPKNGSIPNPPKGVLPPLGSTSN